MNAADEPNKLVYFKKIQRKSGTGVLSIEAINVVMGHIRTLLLVFGINNEAEQTFVMKHPRVQLFMRVFTQSTRRPEVIAGAILWCITSVFPPSSPLRILTWKEVERQTCALFEQNNAMTSSRREELIRESKKPPPQLDASLDNDPDRFKRLYMRVTFPDAYAEFERQQLDISSLRSVDLPMGFRDMANAIRKLEESHPPYGIPTPTKWIEFVRAVRYSGCTSNVVIPRDLTIHLLTHHLLGDTQTKFPTQQEADELNNKQWNTIKHAFKKAVEKIKYSMEEDVSNSIRLIQQSIDEREVDGGVRYWTEIVETSKHYMELACVAARLSPDTKIELKRRLKRQLDLITSKPMDQRRSILGQEIECLAITIVIAATKNFPIKTIVTNHFNAKHLIKVVTPNVLTAPPVSNCQTKLKNLNWILPV